MKRARSLGPTIQSKPDFCPTCDGRRIIKRGLRRNCFRQLQIYWCRDLRNRSEAFDTARSSQSLGQAEVPRAVLPEVKSEEDRSISRNLCSANEAYRAGIFREFSIAGQQRNALHSRLGHKDAIEGVLVSGI